MILVKSDLTVIGGGVAGITFALAAARCGLKTALVQDRDVLGGNMSSECQVGYGSGAISKSYYARESGISDELKMKLFYANPRFHDKEDYYLIDETLLEIVMNEPLISLYLNCSVYDVQCENSEQIKSVQAFSSRTQKHYAFESPLFADASGDGIVAYKSGAEFKIGREASSEYDESLAPAESDLGCMGSCILFNVGKADHEIPFKKPEFAYDYKKDDILKYVNRPETGRELPENPEGMTGLWWLSYAGSGDTIGESMEIDLELKKLVYGYWDYVKNSGDFKGMGNYYLRWVAPFAAKRESRRFIGDYVLTQKDLREILYHYDDISTGGWSIDCHDPQGVYGNGKVSAFGEVPVMYNIPYRITYSKNIKNLFLAGRIVSASHLAMGSLRVMQTLAAMAQASGTAAYLCKKYGCLPADIAKEHIEELQTILQYNGQYISGKKEDCGLAEKAGITASSQRKMENADCTIKFAPKQKYCLVIPTMSGKIDSLEIKVCNISNETKTLHYSLYENATINVYTPLDLIKECSMQIAANENDWIKLDINTEGIKGNKLYIMFEENDSIVLYGSENHITGAPTFEMRGTDTWRIDRSISFRNIVPSEKLYSPENTVNGISRPFGLPNAWVAEAVENEKLTFSFETPVCIKEIQLILNPELQKDYFESGQFARQLIKDYDIRLIRGGKTVCCNSIRNNIIPISRSFYEDVYADCVEIEIKSTHGAPYAEIFAVKIF